MQAAIDADNGDDGVLANLTAEATEDGEVVVKSGLTANSLMFLLTLPVLNRAAMLVTTTA